MHDEISKKSIRERTDMIIETLQLIYGKTAEEVEEIVAEDFKNQLKHRSLKLREYFNSLVPNGEPPSPREIIEIIVRDGLTGKLREREAK